MMDAQHFRVTQRVQMIDGGFEVPRAGRLGTRLLKLLGMKPTRRLTLDAMGMAVWELLDGRTAGNVLDALVLQYPDETELGSRLGRYLGLLEANELIAIDSEEPDTTA